MRGLATVPGRQAGGPANSATAGVRVLSSRNSSSAGSLGSPAHVPFEMRDSRLGVQKVSDVDARLAKDGAERSPSEITGVVRQGDLVTGVLVTPDFVASRARTVILITERPQAPGDLTVLETRHAAQCRTLTGTRRSTAPEATRFDKAGGIGSP